MKISIIIPCYNEEDVLNTLYERINNVSKQLSNYECEFIFVNDGSKDKTENMIEEYHKKDNRVKLFSFSRNFGHQAAVSCGIHHASGDIAIIIDADLQDHGKRISRKGESIFKKITASLFYRIINLLSEVKFPVDTGDFRLIDKNVIEAYKSFNENPKYIRGLISWMGFEQKPFEYERDVRAAGHTKYTLKKMLRLAITGILSFSVRPLRISLFFGILSIFIAIVFSIRVFYLYLFNPEVLVKGWASIIITILFIGGVQLISLSVISEYLANIFNETKKRPEYIVKKKIQ